MSTSYRISYEINAQVILWAILGVIYAAGGVISRLFHRVNKFISLPLLLRIVAYSLAGACIGVALLAVFALVAAQTDSIEYAWFAWDRAGMVMLPAGVHVL